MILFVVETIVVVNKVSHGVMFIPISTFGIPHVKNTIYSYTVFTVSIMVYIPTTVFTLKPHFILLKW